MSIKTAKDGTQTKWCNYHKLDHPVEEFYKSKVSSDGYEYYCQKAIKEIRKIRYKNQKGANDDNNKCY